uniref:Uncharacterized protein n=1 Tax=Timema tahoe TaxID=61484 RepID=A0A7R9IEB8_9NEOP|nr:unnamed protein product [Timema tahoe]
MTAETATTFVERRAGKTAFQHSMIEKESGLDIIMKAAEAGFFLKYRGSRVVGGVNEYETSGKARRVGRVMAITAPATWSRTAPYFSGGVLTMFLNINGYTEPRRTAFFRWNSIHVFKRKWLHESAEHRTASARTNRWKSIAPHFRGALHHPFNNPDEFYDVLPNPRLPWATPKKVGEEDGAI